MLHALASSPSKISNPLNTARPNAAITGIRYFVTEHGRSIRTQWVLPDTAIQRIKQAESSCDGCNKKRYHFIGHRQRTGLWIQLCMVHERVVGFHLIHRGEGRRDAVIPVFRFYENPPVAMWHDFGCGCEESAMNWLPQFFAGTQHFHDAFHGYSHVCPKRFFSRRLPAFAGMNTSLMEQVIVFISYILYFDQVQSTNM
jgi:hypothetical protein